VTDRDEQMLTARDVSKLLQVSGKTIERLGEEDPDFPKPIKVGRQDRYTLGQIRRWQMLQELKNRAASGVPNPDRTGLPRTNKKET
jgi:predicted DNA-binding transcriptional regulator AlpA